MKRVLVALLAVGGLGAGGYLSWAWANGERPFRTPMRLACEKVIVERLRSPSSYRLIDYRETVRSMPHDEARDFVLDELNRLDLLEGNVTARIEKWLKTAEENGGYRRWRAVASYDAANGFGSIIRGTSTCDYAGYTIDQSMLNLAIEVDGETPVEYLAERLE